MKIPLSALFENKHTRYAMIIYVICKVGLQISEVWFKTYSQQLRATADIIEGLAVAYGVSAAGAGNPPLKVVDAELKAQKAQEQAKV